MENKSLYELKIGDRFYFKDDRNRKTWQVDFIDKATKKNFFNKEVDGKIIHYKDDLNHFEKEKHNKPVVYVRNVFEV